MIKKGQVKKIAIFHCGFIYTGGGERIVIEEILGLRERGYKVDCFVPTLDKKLSYPDIIESLGIKTFLPQLPEWFPLRFAISLVATCLSAPFLVKKFKSYDIFLGANQPGAFMAWVIAGILRKPYFVYLSQPNRVLYPRDHEDWQNVKDYYFLNKIINHFFKNPVVLLDTKSITGGRELFINGSFVANEIVRVYKPKSWTDCPGGAHPEPKEVLKINRFVGKIKIDHQLVKKPYLLFTSRHEPWKRFDWAIKATEIVVKKYPNVRLVIPGAETCVTPRLKTLTKKLGISEKVIFTGPIDQKSLWRLYQNAAVYVFTSPKEDLGIVVEEAQAAAVPVVAWNSGGPTVTVISGKTGYLVEPSDISKLAQKIIYLLENPAKRNAMGRAAREHIARNFSWRRHIDILEKFFVRID